MSGTDSLDAVVAAALSNGSSSGSGWTVGNNGSMVDQGVPVPSTNIDMSGETATVQDDEAQRLKDWNTALQDSSHNITQLTNEMLAAQNDAKKTSQDILTEYHANKAKLSTLQQTNAHGMNNASITSLQAQLKQELQELQNLLVDQELLAKIKAQKLAAAHQTQNPGGTGPAGPTGGAGPPGATAGAGGTGPAGSGTQLAAAYTPNGSASAGTSNGASDGTGSFPMMMPMPMGGMGSPMGGSPMGGSPMSAMDSLGATGALGATGSTDLTANAAGATGPKPQNINASNTTSTDGAKTPPSGGAAVHPASSPLSAGNSMPAGSNADVKLPDGTTTQAPNTQAANATRTVQRGTTPADAGQQAGVPLAPLSAMSLNSGRAGGRANQRRRDVEQPSSDGDQNSNRSQRR
jgi:hypothetical protein